MSERIVEETADGDHFGPRFRDWRTGEGLTLRDVKHQTGLSIGFLSKWERGLRHATPATTAKLMALRGLTEEEIERELARHPDFEARGGDIAARIEAKHGSGKTASALWQHTLDILERTGASEDTAAHAEAFSRLRSSVLSAARTELASQPVDDPRARARLLELLKILPDLDIEQLEAVLALARHFHPRGSRPRGEKAPSDAPSDVEGGDGDEEVA